MFAKALVVCLALSSIAISFIDAAPRITSLGRNLNCGVRMPQLPNVRPKSRSMLRIGNGFTPHRQVWPWMVSMMFGSGRSWSHGCGGSLINNRYVVTAAHCVSGSTAAGIRLRFGSYDRRSREPGEFESIVKKIISHRNYSTNENAGLLYNDIALLQLDKPVTLNEYVNVVCLPSSTPRFFQNETFTITGWGRKLDDSLADTLQQVEVPAINQTTCSERWARSLPRGAQGQFCTAVVDQRDSCKGDSGGPVMLYEDGRWILYGLVSAGSSLCGSDVLPSLNVNVISYIDWILSNIAAEENQ